VDKDEWSEDELESDELEFEDELDDDSDDVEMQRLRLRVTGKGTLLVDNAAGGTCLMLEKG